MRALELIRGHVIFKLRYNQIYQLKTTLVFEHCKLTYCLALHTTMKKKVNIFNWKHLLFRTNSSNYCLSIIQGSQFESMSQLYLYKDIS